MPKFKKKQKSESKSSLLRSSTDSLATIDVNSSCFLVLTVWLSPFMVTTRRGGRESGCCSVTTYIYMLVLCVCFLISW
jgi:hypothetical protein